MNNFTLKYPKFFGLVIFVVTTVVLFIAGFLFVLAFGGTSPKSPSGQPTGSAMPLLFVMGLAAIPSLMLGSIAGVSSSVFFVRRKNRMP